MTTLDYYRFLENDHGKILAYNRDQMESDHGFIQWLFPTTIPSMFNSAAPRLNLVELRRDHRFGIAQTKMIESALRICEHWGIYIDGIDLSSFRLLDGHNGLRLSRVLQSLVYHDLEYVAREILDIVMENISKLRSVTYTKSGKTLWEARLDEALYEVSGK